VKTTKFNVSHNLIIRVKKDNRYLLINNLIGLGLAGIALTSFTAGIYFEILIVGLLIGIPFFLFHLIKQPNWIWRIGFLALLGFQIYSFSKEGIVEDFEVSLNGYFMSSGQIEDTKWLAPISAGVCLTSFWVVLISTLKSSKKTLPNK